MIFGCRAVLMVVHAHTTPSTTHRTRSGRYDQRSARTALAQKNLRDDHVVASRGPVPLPGPGVSKPLPALLSNRRVITIALELELARVWRGYLVFFPLGAC